MNYPVRLEHLSLVPSRSTAEPTTRRSAKGSGSRVELRPGVWKLTVSTGQYEDGSRRREHLIVEADGEVAATEALAAFGADVRSRAQLAEKSDRDTTVDEGVTRFLDEYLRGEKGRARRTVDGYGELHKRWGAAVIGRKRLRDVTEDDVDVAPLLTLAAATGMRRVRWRVIVASSRARAGPASSGCSSSRARTGPLPQVERHGGLDGGAEVHLARQGAGLMSAQPAAPSTATMRSGSASEPSDPRSVVSTGRLGVEGVVAERCTSRCYLCGRRSTAWVKVKHRHSGWFDVDGWRLACRSVPTGGLVLSDEGAPAGTAISALPGYQRAAFHRFTERHGTLVGDVVRLPPAVRVRVEFLERSATGLLREAVAREVRPSMPRPAA